MFFWDDIKNDLKDKLRVTVVEQRGYPLSSIENSIVSDFNIENLSLDIENLINNFLKEKINCKAFIVNNPSETIKIINNILKQR